MQYSQNNWREYYNGAGLSRYGSSVDRAYERMMHEKFFKFAKRMGVKREDVERYIEEGKTDAGIFARIRNKGNKNGN